MHKSIMNMIMNDATLQYNQYNELDSHHCLCVTLITINTA
jgi:hypothetical protein